MNLPEDKRIFAWVDQLELEADKKGLEATEPPTEVLDAETMARIKARTLSKIGLRVTDRQQQPPAQTEVSKYPKRSQAAIAASLLLLALCGALIIGSEGVRAQVRKALQFIPGYASVTETSDEESVRYVLPSSFDIPKDHGTLQVRGISIGNKQSFMDVAGTNTTMSTKDEMVLLNNKGNSYTFRQRFSSYSGLEWTGELYFQGKIEVTPEMKIAMNGDIDHAVSLNLEPPHQGNQIQDLGLTVEKNGISLTAITVDEADGRTKVSLIPQHKSGIRIDAFGITPYSYNTKASLMKDDHSDIPFEQDLSFPNPNVFYYKKDLLGASVSHLMIPALSGTHKLTEPIKITVPVPKEGSITVNGRYTIAGYPVDLLKVERLAPTNQESIPIRLTWDVHYDDTKNTSLLQFHPDFSREFKSGGSSWKVNDTTRALEEMEISADPEKDIYTFYVSEIYILFRGPWSFELK
jgi:hypothetical protein